MLEETVQELKGEEIPLEIHSTLNLGLDIRIPQEYIADEHQRLRTYKRISDARNEEEAAKIRAELEDRYGPLPDAVLNSVAVFRCEEPGGDASAWKRLTGGRGIEYQVPPTVEDQPGQTAGDRQRNGRRSIHAGRSSAPPAKRN